ncbi:MAG TPA: cytochrome b/b6 domain-containing protein [Desulfobacteria bacterium]|nr:cytochrome b/b6 domain-containing protein [Desulfobacteria bacterium]
MYKLTLRQSAFLRIYHWLLVLLILIIVPTGFYIHKPFSFLQLDFRTLLNIHFFAGFALSYLLMARAYYAIFRQDYQTVLFTWQDFKELPALFSYYLFFRAEKPPEQKYNAGQRLVYSLWYISLSIANISGALAYKKTDFLPIAKILGGVHHLDWLTLGSALFLAYTVPLHIYLSVTENMGFSQAILTGYTYELKPDGMPPVEQGQRIKTFLPGQWLLNKLAGLVALITKEK